MTSLKWRIRWSSVAGWRENPHADRYRLRFHFYKRIQRGTFLAVASKNQSDRLVSSLVTASEEYEEAIWKRKIWKFVHWFPERVRLPSRSVYSMGLLYLTQHSLVRRFSAYFGILYLYKCTGTTIHVPSLHRVLLHSLILNVLYCDRMTNSCTEVNKIMAVTLTRGWPSEGNTRQ